MPFDLERYMEAAFGPPGDWDERRLLHAFVYASVRVIEERSGSISADCKKLRRWADKYAVTELGVEPVQFDWDLYISPDDES